MADIRGNSRGDACAKASGLPNALPDIGAVFMLENAASAMGGRAIVSSPCDSISAQLQR